MAAHQVVKTSTTKTTTIKNSYKGLASIAHAATGGGYKGGTKRGRPVGSKDTRPRKTRSDKGKPRGHYRKRAKR